MDLPRLSEGASHGDHSADKALTGAAPRTCDAVDAVTATVDFATTGLKGEDVSNVVERSYRFPRESPGLFVTGDSAVKIEPASDASCAASVPPACEIRNSRIPRNVLKRA